MLRRILLAASAVGGAAAFGRKIADKAIEKRLASEIEAAKALAIAELDREIDGALRARLVGFALGVVVKAGLVAAAFAGFRAGLYEEMTFRIVATGLLAAFLGHDAVRAAPYLPTAVQLMREYGINVRAAITEYAAAAAFERAYRETSKRLTGKRVRGLIAVSTYTPGAISEQVAEAVAQVAEAVTFKRAATRAAVAAAQAAGLFVLYAVIVGLAFSV
ncbi:MAG: hypothetical protein AAGC56_02020 [Pseudomonadota bacterium]